MASISVNVYVRARRMWAPRLAAYTGSIRLFEWALRLVRVQTRVSARGRWRDAGRLTYNRAEGRIEGGLPR